VKRSFYITRFARPGESLRAVAARAPQAEAMVASWIARVQPLAVRLYAMRRRIATISVILLAASLLGRVMFGANGMVVYRQKRAEYDTLRRQIQQVQEENNRYMQQIRGLQGDDKAIEKEAREQLGYAKPGEYVYVPPASAKSSPPTSRSAKK